MPTVLFVSRVTLPPGERGNAAYSLDCVAALRQAGLDVRVLVTEGRARIPAVWDTAPTPEEQALVRAAIEETRPDVLFVNYTYLAELLPLAPAGCLRGILAHDARHLRHADFMARGLKAETSPWSEADERAALELADFVAAIQAGEAAEFARLAPRLRVVTAPCSFAPLTLPPPEAPDACLFVGSGADHNLCGLEWFLAEVWPGVLAARPSARLRICGGVGGRLKNAPFPGVEVLGRVENLTPHYAWAAVAVAPLLAGSGLKLKLVEALAMGRGCVATPTSLAGLEARDCVIEAETPEAFRDALLALFADPGRARAMGAAGRELVRSRFTRAACYGPLLELLGATLSGDAGAPARGLASEARA